MGEWQWNYWLEVKRAGGDSREGVREIVPGLVGCAGDVAFMCKPSWEPPAGGFRAEVGHELIQVLVGFFWLPSREQTIRGREIYCKSLLCLSI